MVAGQRHGRWQPKRQGALPGHRDRDESPHRARRRDILHQEAEVLRARIAAAQYPLELIESTLGCDHENFTQCAHFRQKVAERIGVDAPAHIPV